MGKTQHLKQLYSFEYNQPTPWCVETTQAFDDWLHGLKDRAVRVRLIRRLVRAANGNLGDVRSVGEGVFEMREHVGAGWRMYFVNRGDRLIVMLGGGDKRTQSRDVARAIRWSQEL